MAPSSRRREKTTTTTTTTKKSTPTSSNRRIITRSIYKKQQLLLSQQTTITTPTKKIVHPTCDLTPTPNTDNINNASFVDGCSTPKSEKYKIPAIVTCPPAPKKPKVSSSNCFLHKRPITFFVHPDLDKFFMFSSRDIKS
ncbi:hypothetical protein RND81_12G181000 [Saponaria officinalis]|uniref:Uncharacterized protein n=1 Tax=Saponaria officinalis TaxID=3572 RepID=A0AAW1HCA5_SAPOF